MQTKNVEGQNDENNDVNAVGFMDETSNIIFTGLDDGVIQVWVCVAIVSLWITNMFFYRSGTIAAWTNHAMSQLELWSVTMTESRTSIQKWTDATLYPIQRTKASSCGTCECSREVVQKSSRCASIKTRRPATPQIGTIDGMTCPESVRIFKYLWSICLLCIWFSLQRPLADERWYKRHDVPWSSSQEKFDSGEILAGGVYRTTVHLHRLRNRPTN